MRHIIRTQVLDVLTDNSTDAFEMQHAMSSVFYRTILPTLEKAFDELAPEGKLITFDSLQIDIGNINLDNFSKSDCIYLIKDQLIQQIKAKVAHDSIKGEHPETFNSVLERWLYYMEHGYLPWNTLSIPENWMDEVIYQLENSTTNVKMLRSLILRRKEAASRIASQNTTQFLSKLIIILTNESIVGFSELLRSMVMLIDDPNRHLYSSVSSKKEQIILWREVICFAAQDKDIHTSQELFIDAVIPVLTKHQVEKLNKVSESALPSEIRPFLAKMKKAIKESVKHQRDVVPVKKGESVTLLKDKIPEEGLFVKNAGIVLLHPFLGSFFKLNKWLEDGKFISKEAQQQAIAVLHFLVSGASEMEEHEAVVYKILCGFPIEESLEGCWEVSEIQKKESIGLLESVIENWTILKKTSVDTLRDCFLQRNGKLVNTSGGDIRLLIENDSLDVLLEHLPWGISMIKQPWMLQILKVEWH